MGVGESGVYIVIIENVKNINLRQSEHKEEWGRLTITLSMIWGNLMSENVIDSIQSVACGYKCSPLPFIFLQRF